MSLSEIVDVVITKDTVTVSQAGFGILMIVGPNININSRFELFTTASDATAKLVGASTLEAAQISDAFAQQPSVNTIALGSIMSSKTAIFAGTMTAGSITGIVNGTSYAEAFDTDMDTTLTNLATAMQVDSDVSTAVYTAGTDTMVITPATDTTIGIEYTISAATGLTGVTETATELTETYPEALALIIAENNSWYGLVIADRTIAKQELVADWVEANKKVFSIASADANIIGEADGVDTTTIAYYVKVNSLSRSFVTYSADATTQGIDAAVLGKIFPNLPGTYTAMFKTLASITVSTLTPTQSTNARDKNANTYEPIGGVNIYREGKVGDGEYIDIVIFIDWLHARIQESVYASLVGPLKVPYTSKGIDIVRNAMNGPLSLGQSRGGISPQLFDSDNVQVGGYNITVPLIETVPTVDKTNRILKEVKFTAWLAGAIHAVEIRGTVTI